MSFNPLRHIEVKGHLVKFDDRLMIKYLICFTLDPLQQIKEHLEFFSLCINSQIHATFRDTGVVMVGYKLHNTLVNNPKLNHLNFLWKGCLMFSPGRNPAWLTRQAWFRLILDWIHSLDLLMSIIRTWNWHRWFHNAQHLCVLINSGNDIIIIFFKSPVLISIPIL